MSSNWTSKMFSRPLLCRSGLVASNYKVKLFLHESHTKVLPKINLKYCAKRLCSTLNDKPTLSYRDRKRTEFDKIEKQQRLENEKFRKHRLEQMQMHPERNYYPHKFEYTMTLSNFVDQFSSLSTGEISSRNIRLCGRINKIRNYGKNLKFMDLSQKP